MTRERRRRECGAGLSVLAVGLWLGAVLSPGLAVAETRSVKQQLLDLTGGRRVKVAWNQGEKDKVPLIRFIDTNEGVVRELPFAGNNPWLTPDGTRILAVAGTETDRTLMMYDTESGKATPLAKGPHSFPLAVWRDPRTGREWVYVNAIGAGGNLKRGWADGQDKMYRFPIDKPEARELFWDRTTSSEFFMLSADGTHACFGTTFNNIGQLKLAYDAQGRVDQDKSTFKPAGHGCFPGGAPDNSYRLFRLDGDHHTITMFDADLVRPRQIRVSEMPGVREKGRNVWLTRWSTHPRYLTLVAPSGDDAGIWLGRFDEAFTKVEAWVRVTAPGPQCWKSHAWIEPEPSAGPARGAPVGDKAPAAAQAPEWPRVPEAVFALRNVRAATPVTAFDARGRRLMAFNCAPRGRGLFGRFHDLVCDGGSFLARDAGPWVGLQVAKTGAFTIEATLTPAETPPTSRATVLAYGDATGEDAALLQENSGLSLRLGGTRTIALFPLEPGKRVHVLVACDKRAWAAYRDGRPAGSGPLAAGGAAWGTRQLLLGAAWSDAQPWRGRMEGVAVFPRALTADEAAGEAAAAGAWQAGRKPATAVRFRGTLLRQAKTADLAAIRPYTRSMTAAEYKVEKVLSGEWKQPTITVLHWTIMDGKRLPIADRKAGVEVDLRVEPLDEHPQLESCRRDDEIEGRLCADLFYCESEPDPAAGAPRGGRGDAAGFRKFCAEKAAAGDSMAVGGRDGWLFLRSELRHIGVGCFWGEAAVNASKATSPDKADPLPAILDFNRQLKASGIDLILVPVPCKALVYPEAIDGGAAERLDAVHQQFFALLGDKGVKVLDLAGTFLTEKAGPGRPLLYCKTDTHWTPYACEVTARHIRKELGSPGWLQGRPDRFTTAQDTRTITGDLADGKGSEELPVRVVQASGGAIEDRASPILLLGDSHTLVFHGGEDLHGVGAGLADQLAAELGVAIDVIGVRGSGATPARVNLMRRARATPGYLAGKKAVIWCFAAREFTESTGWSVFNLAR